MTLLKKQKKEILICFSLPVTEKTITGYISNVLMTVVLIGAIF